MLFTIGDIHEGTRYRIKDREKALIFQSICTERETTRKRIAENLKLRPTTVSAVTQELIEDSLIEETTNRSAGKPGRPELKLIPNNNRLTAISIFVEGKKLKGKLVNMGEEILAENEYSLENDVENEEVERTIFRLTEELKKANPQDSKLLGAGVSLVGTVDSKEKRWITCARWNRIKNLDFKRIEEKSGLKITIRRALDTELEYQLIKFPEYRKENILLFHWGYGIGSAFAFHGKVLTSSIGRFAEIGHTRVPGADDRPCLCGSRGCLETVAAMWALLPELKEMHGIETDDERSFADILETESIARSKVIKKAISHVSIGLTNIFRILYPDHILLIGPFTENQVIFERLILTFDATLPGYMKGAVGFSTIRGGFKGSIYGNVYTLFLDKLKELLKMRA